MSCHARFSGLFVPLVLLGASPVLAAVAFPSRTTVAAINGTKSDFSDASLTIRATTQVGAGSSGSRVLDFFTPPGLLAATGSATGAVLLTPPVVLPGDEVTATVTATGGGTFTIAEQFAADPDGSSYSPLHYFAPGELANPDYSGFLPPFLNTNLTAIELFLPFVGGGGLVDQNGAFTYQATIKGNYSTTGGLASGSGQYFLAGLDPAWLRPTFTYDAATNLTTFSTINPSYDYTADGGNGQALGLDLFFFGSPSPAPEPTTWATMILGFAGIGLGLRRKQAATFATA